MFRCTIGIVLITINPTWRSLRITQKAIENAHRVCKGSLTGPNLSEIKRIEIHKRICNYLFLSTGRIIKKQQCRIRWESLFPLVMSTTRWSTLVSLLSRSNTSATWLASHSHLRSMPDKETDYLFIQHTLSELLPCAWILLGTEYMEKRKKYGTFLRGTYSRPKYW